MVDAVSSTTTADKVTSGFSRLADNEETFLKLLTTQLKNQDPLSPLDSNQFTAQITQMTGVEQQLLTNKLLQSMIDGQGSNEISQALSMIGRVATAVDDTAALKNGAATWTYNLGADAKDVAMVVKNADGDIVWRGTSDQTKKGDHTFTWNGKGDTSASLPDGTYTLTVSAKDAGGTDITVSNKLSGLVTAVEMEGGVPVVTINGAKVPVSSVVKIEAVAG